MNYRLNPHFFVMLAPTLALLGATGCSTLAVNQASTQAANADAKEALAVDKKTPSFSVQFKTDGGRVVHAKQIPIEGEVFIQEALDKSGAFKRFRRLSITPQGAPHRMTVAHDRIKHRVEPQCNYHIHPGDTVVITEDKRTVLDDMMGSLGPFGNKQSPPRSGPG
jgi:hypothetical protein